MSNETFLKMFLSSLAVQLPTLLVCLVATVVVVVKWRDASRGSIWALLGFGLALGISMIGPVVQTSVQHWVMQGSEVAQRASVMTALAVFWSIMRGVSYALLLVAVFAGRSNPQSPSPLPLNQG